jgi:hypothetical protein
MKHLLNDLSEEEKNNIREQHAGGMKVSNTRFNTLLETKSGDVKPFILEREAPERLVKHIDSGKIVGTHKYGVGYIPNEFGKSLGHSSHPTSIPDLTKIDDDDDDEMNDMISSRLSQPKRRPQRGRGLDEKYSISEQGTTPTLSATTGSTNASIRKADNETARKIYSQIIGEYGISDSEVKKSVEYCIKGLCNTLKEEFNGLKYLWVPQSLDQRLKSYEGCRKNKTNATQFLPPAKVVELLKTIM